MMPLAHPTGVACIQPGRTVHAPSGCGISQFKGQAKSPRSCSIVSGASPRAARAPSCSIHTPPPKRNRTPRHVARVGRQLRSSTMSAARRSPRSEKGGRQHSRERGCPPRSAHSPLNASPLGAVGQDHRDRSRGRGQAVEVHGGRVDVLVARRVEVVRRAAHGLGSQSRPAPRGARRARLCVARRHRRVLPLGALQGPNARLLARVAVRDGTGRRGPDRARGAAGREPRRPSRDRVRLPPTLRLLLPAGRGGSTSRLTLLVRPRRRRPPTRPAPRDHAGARRPALGVAAA